MAQYMTPFEIRRWNNDDQALAYLLDAHWDAFFTEPRYGKHGVESRKHQAWRKALGSLERAVIHLRTHTPAWKVAA